MVGAVVMPSTPSELLRPTDGFLHRHIDVTDADLRAMLDAVGVADLEALVERTVPASIRMKGGLDVGPARGEQETLAMLATRARKNQVVRSFLGLGYHGVLVPGVIERNILQNPGWYTAYTPYQAEIAQGRLEALLNFQTVVADLTGLPLANASLLDEATAAAEAMAMAHRLVPGDRTVFFVAERVHPQTLAVVRARAEAIGLRVEVGDPATADLAALAPFGALLQYPDTDGVASPLADVVTRIHDAGALAVVATDLLALTLLQPPGEVGVDIAVGSAQRFGVPMGFGGPHAAFMATKDEHKRQIPGRVIGVSKDAAGHMALRMSMQTREQHIRREKATSNICTAQVLLAIMASMYAVYHGPDGLTKIATRVHGATKLLAGALAKLGHRVPPGAFFDTIVVGTRDPGGADAVVAAALDRGINVRKVDGDRVAVALDETVTEADLRALVQAFGGVAEHDFAGQADALAADRLGALARSSAFLTHPVFHRHRGEHEMLRYIRRLEAKDLSLTTSMIPLGSCTMKLNATSEMVPVSWPEFAHLHPFVPASQSQGYREMIGELECWLANITGFDAVSMQPNAGSQGEYTGLLVIRAYHQSRGQGHRDVCLIPVSAHGTNPASAIMAGMRVVVVACDAHGNIDVADLRKKAAAHANELAALMVTYPSTHGVFEGSIRELIDVVHEHGGQVYLDGANMNAQVGLCRPGDYGADVCHLNLHKTFCIPHGGGGPGMGPIGVKSQLAPFLPGHPLAALGGAQAIGPVAAAPWGSASILPIPWMYIAMMGSDGLRRATQLAILNANYMAKRLSSEFEILYRGEHGMVAHEFILDLRPFKASCGIEAEDVAKRLMDYGFHAPTMSFPVAGTLMIEPTESESKGELDRLCDALISIRREIARIERGEWPKDDNPLKHAPHTAAAVTADAWSHPYTREQAAWPAAWLRTHKYWPPVARVDNAWGDRNLVCSCPPLEAYDAPTTYGESGAYAGYGASGGYGAYGGGRLGGR
ncbi:MAG: aminomethyl-transferring glycine dehydrogenase [Deltaproteobacteria bacterium]|nr:aminomethyl-transferring glycine dehydrogenase [Deltaproteobacteria bacterium]